MTAEHETILLVDDTPENLDILVGILKDEYRLRVATDGQSALELAAATPPELVLLDIMMPGMDGFEVCRRLKADQALRDVPVIFVSSLDETRHKLRAFAAGGADYVTKPFQPDEVEARVAIHLRLRRLQRELEHHNVHLEELVAERTRDLVRANEKLRALDDAKGEFLRSISHELRTPANGVLGIADLAFDCSPGSQESTELRGLFERSQGRMLAVLDDALLLTQIEVSADMFTASSASLGTVLASVRRDVAASAAAAHASLAAVPACGAVRVLCDEALLQRALTALWRTAAAFTSDGHLVRLLCQEQAECVRLVLEGDGRALPVDALPTFLDVFSKSRSSTYAEELGFGPALAARIITLFGGSVTIESVSPPGVRIEIMLRKPEGAEHALQQ